ncbi:hypothetical protein [Flagellimonas sp.]|uniref:hypothetical protein n=1 Tax=Flagellimonas sp. TaxID=2058762 RepID=UPI003B5BF4B3
MRLTALAIVLFLSVNSFSQENSKSIGKFVRVFDLQGNKIAKGKIQSLSENELRIKTRKLSMKLPINNIGKIKMGRAGGTNVGIGAIAGALIGIVDADDNGLFGATQAENIAILSFSGAILGSAVGGLSTIFKKNKRFEINGDGEKWKAFVQAISL